MLLEDLVGCIELLQERIRSYSAPLRENETRTRMALIDPLLRALDWDVSDPGVVTPEYRVKDGWADYALLRPRRLAGSSRGGQEARRGAGVPPDADAQLRECGGH